MPVLFAFVQINSHLTSWFAPATNAAGSSRPLPHYSSQGVSFNTSNPKDGDIQPVTPSFFPF